jgi:hypothetical protein
MVAMIASHVFDVLLVLLVRRLVFSGHNVVFELETSSTILKKDPTDTRASIFSFCWAPGFITEAVAPFVAQGPGVRPPVSWPQQTTA